LLGVFFISVGAGIDVHQIMASPLQVALTVVAFLVVKTILGIGLGRVAKLRSSDAVLFGVSLAQGSEFAFVVLALAGQVGLITTQQQQGWTSVVAMSMALAPLLITGTIKFVLPRLVPKTPTEAPRQPDTPQEVDNHIIVVGMGRFGQIIVRLLRANGFPTTALDYDAEQIEVMKRFGYKAYFGDARNYDLLRAAGIERARGVVLALDDKESTTLILQSIREHHQELPVYARAYDRVHAYKLIHEGATEIAIETGGSALNLGVKVLENLGYDRLRAFRQARLFQNHTDSNIRELAQLYQETDEKSFFLQARERIFLLENILAQEAGLKKVDDRSWESPPRTD
jgi:voltage-gated potassium channel Kch